ncbi:hypothetical protein [Flavobacterium aciduliphilum]|uniref:hypothetical protein n=1 Tax=Flavobacterium aciduliphilum TaxID=1101402 RepID=UPI000DD33EFA|nr:hypothetical protein [Flavobacterium aciduliphilum]
MPYLSFFFLYKGYDKKEGELFPSDSFMTNFAGVCALLVAIFPMDFNLWFPDNFRSFISHRLAGTIHYYAAFFFFLSLGIICIINFRRTNTIENFGKMPSHNFYKMCGFGIFGSLFLIILFKSIPFLHQWAVQIGFPYLFWFETTSLLFFGASWLKKGQVSNN